MNIVHIAPFISISPPAYLFSVLMLRPLRVGGHWGKYLMPRGYLKPGFNKSAVRLYERELDQGLGTKASGCLPGLSVACNAWQILAPEHKGSSHR